MYKGHFSWKKLNTFALLFHSVLQGISPTLFLALFYLGPPQKKLNLSDLPFMSISPRNFGEPDSSPWNIPLSKKAKTHFLKKLKILFPIMKWKQFESWNMNIQFQNLKIKGVRLLYFLFYFISVWYLVRLNRHF